MMGMHLQCDADDCTHVEPVEAITEDQIGMPCPKCGANLLTREDFEVGKRIEAGLNMLKRMGLAHDADGGDIPEGQTLMSVNPHAGDLNFSFKMPKRSDDA